VRTNASFLRSLTLTGDLSVPQFLTTAKRLHKGTQKKINNVSVTEKWKRKIFKLESEILNKYEMPKTRTAKKSVIHAIQPLRNRIGKYFTSKKDAEIWNDDEPVTKRGKKYYVEFWETPEAKKCTAKRKYLVTRLANLYAKQNEISSEAHHHG